MADTKREIERKYEATPETRLPDLTRVPGVATVVDQGTTELDAVYYDTPDLRLAAAAITLRRRTGGDDAGWHLKLPVAPGVRDEIRSPLSAALPRTLKSLIRARTRTTEPEPVIRLLSSREIHLLLDADGTPLAELSRDAVRAERLDDGRTAHWDEIEVELADDGDPALLDKIGKRLRKAGITASDAPSKLARALGETGLDAAFPAAPPAPSGDAGSFVLGYLRDQVTALLGHDPGVRRNTPDAVHQMRVATRRLRSAFRSYSAVLDRTVTDPIGEELKWLAGELGAARDTEVLAERLRAGLDALPRTLLLGPVRGRLRIWTAARGSGSRRRALTALDSARYLALLTALDTLLADPPLRKRATGAPESVLPKALLKDYGRLADRIGHALALPAGPDRDLAMHDARKAAKRARYAGEAATAALGRPAKWFAKRMKAVQTVLGDHQDSVVARDTLRDLAIQAHAAGESAFTWGLLYGREQRAAADRELELPGVWSRAAPDELRKHGVG